MTAEDARIIIINERDSLKANPLVKVEDCLYEAYEMAIKALEIQPTKPSAKWEKFVDDYNKCSECGVICKFWRNYKYCPNCGGRMAESEDEE